MQLPLFFLGILTLNIIKPYYKCDEIAAVSFQLIRETDNCWTFQQVQIQYFEALLCFISDTFYIVHYALCTYLHSTSNSGVGVSNTLSFTVPIITDC